MWMLFAVWAGPNNWTTHTYFHGTLTGHLLSGRWDGPWVVEMLWVGGSFIGLFILVTIASEGGLSAPSFPAWWLSTFTMVCLGALWMANMIWLFINANKEAYPLNIANSRQWGSAFDNVTLSQISRYRPLPEDVLTPGQLSVNTDFIWLWVAGSIVWVALLAIWILYTVRWVRIERARERRTGVSSNPLARTIGEHMTVLQRMVQPLTGAWWLTGGGGNGGTKQTKYD